MSYDEFVRRRHSGDDRLSSYSHGGQGADTAGLRRPSQHNQPAADFDDYDEYDAETERQRAEVAEMMQRTEGIRDETLESTRNLARITAESERIGVETMEELERQNESLDRTNRNLDSIDSNARAAERHLTNMEKFLGLFTMPWNRQSNIERTSQYKAAYKTPAPEPAQSRAADATPVRKPSGASAASAADRNRLFGDGGNVGKEASGTRTFGDGGDVPSYKRGLNEVQAQKEGEIDSNMDAVGDSVRRLKALALGLGDQIDASNVKIDHITAKTEVSSMRVANAKARTAQLLK